MKFTQGLWTINRIATKDDPVAYIGAGINGISLRAESSLCPQEGKELDDQSRDEMQAKLIDECNANACLIAGAPELYEAAKKALDFLDNTARYRCIIGVVDGIGEQELADLSELIRTAIQKAEEGSE